MTCAYYHWWCYEGEPAPYANLRAPILLSIATLRAVSKIPIVVLDVSSQLNDWGHFPQKLNFEVHNLECRLDKYNGHIDGWRHLSRIFDLRHWSIQRNRTRDLIYYVDSDVFFLRDPLPLSGNPNQFCWDGWNTGLFYFYPSNFRLKDFYDIFKSYCIAGIYSKDFRDIMKSHVSYDAWYGVWDEMVLGYMKHKHPELFYIIPKEEHVTARTISSVDSPKAFHCNGSMISNPITGEVHARGVMCLKIQEFYDKITQVLDADDMRLVFGSELLEKMDGNRVSLFKSMPELPSIVDATGHYQFNRLGRRSLII